MIATLILSSFFMQEDMFSIFAAFGESQTNDRSSDAETVSVGSSHLVSVVVHYLLKNLPATFVGNDALNISKMVRSSADLSMPQVRHTPNIESKRSSNVSISCKGRGQFAVCYCGICVCGTMAVGHITAL